mgnify:CR=1 FL=1
MRGDPNCEKCKGHGRVYQDNGREPPSAAVCSCTRRQAVIDNLERGWTGLTNARRLDEPSSLLHKTKQNLWITAPTDELRAHLRHVALRRGPRWNFSVYADWDMVYKWLEPIPRRGGELYDADYLGQIPTRLHGLEIIEYPELLIVRLGVKTAPNKAAPEVFLEALMRREHTGKPTWVFDQPIRPLVPGHLCYSKKVIDFLGQWERVHLGTSVGGANCITRRPGGLAAMAGRRIAPSAPQARMPRPRFNRKNPKAAAAPNQAPKAAAPNQAPTADEIADGAEEAFDYLDLNFLDKEETTPRYRSKGKSSFGSKGFGKKKGGRW